MKRLAVILLGTIFLLGIALRLYQHTETPPGLYWDEVSIGYNAYSIVETGKDEWGEAFPIIFKAFGEYKLPGYIYLTVPFVFLLGLSESAVRLPSILLGSLTILVLFGLVRKLGLGTKAASLAALIFACSPWHLQFSRAGFEAVACLFFILLGFLLFLNVLGGKTRFLLPALLSLLAAVYTYHNALVILPVMGPIFLVSLTRLYKSVPKSKKNVIVLCLIVTLLASLPYLKDYVFSTEGRTRANSENIFKMKGNLLQNFSTNLSSSFSLDYLFFHGDQNGRHSVKKIGELYSWQLVFLLVGIYLVIKGRSPNGKLVVFFLFISTLPAVLTTIAPHALRSLPATASYSVLTAVGLAAFARWLGRSRTIFSALLALIVFYQVFTYLHLYYVHARISYALDWQYGFRETVRYVKTISSRYDHVYLSPDLPPTYLLFYLPVNPKTLQLANHNINKLGNFQYYLDFPNPPVKKSPTEKNLVVIPAGMVNSDIEILREIRLLNRDPLFKIYEY